MIVYSFCVMVYYKCLSVCDYLRVYEKMMERMQEIGASITGFKKTLSQWAKKKGLQGNHNIQKKYVDINFSRCKSCSE